jgi:hypothetical protein
VGALRYLACCASSSGLENSRGKKSTPVTRRGDLISSLHLIMAMAELGESCRVVSWWRVWKREGGRASHCKWANQQSRNGTEG